MSSGVYRNLGRGGAGNYYSKADLEEAAKRIPQDLEAQNPSSCAAADDTPSTQEYSHLGRGGAGNVTLTALMGKAATSDSQPPVGSSQASPMSGRGGAGNYHGAEQEMLETERAAKEAEAAEEVRRKIQEEVNDVEKGLMPPQKAYMGQ